MLQRAKKHAAKFIYGDHLSCYVINEAPLILVSYFSDCYYKLDAYASRIENRDSTQPVYLFFQLGYHVESERRLTEVYQQHEAVKERMPHVHTLFLTNSPTEEENLKRLGLDAMYAHQNAFLDPRRYPLVNRSKKYDAIYLARFTPAKRHELARDIKSLKLIGDHMIEEQSYYDASLRHLSHADLERKVYNFQVSRALSRASVGLCLSAEEGAMFVSAEYHLAGLPAVSTSNLGGRHHLMPKDCFLEVPDDPKLISEAVDELKRRQLSPENIRSQIIEKMAWHKARLQDRINQIRIDNGFQAQQIDLPHKLCLRTRVPVSLRNKML